MECLRRYREKGTGGLGARSTPRVTIGVIASLTIVTHHTPNGPCHWHASQSPPHHALRPPAWEFSHVASFNLNGSNGPPAMYWVIGISPSWDGLVLLFSPDSDCTAEHHAVASDPAGHRSSKPRPTRVGREWGYSLQLTTDDRDPYLETNCTSNLHISDFLYMWPKVRSAPSDLSIISQWRKMKMSLDPCVRIGAVQIFWNHDDLVQPR